MREYLPSNSGAAISQREYEIGQIISLRRALKDGVAILKKNSWRAKTRGGNRKDVRKGKPNTLLLILVQRNFSPEIFLVPGFDITFFRFVVLSSRMFNFDTAH